MNNLTLMQQVAVYALPLILAITLHEAAHAFAARRFGDSTAYMLGRMTLNPIKHIDLFGTIILPLICVSLGGFIFGWAKPVPVNFSALRPPRRGQFCVAAAGPLSNLLMAIIWTLLFKLAVLMNNSYSVPLALMSRAGLFLNLSLMALNLFPLLPLDGGRIVESILPRRWAWQYSRLEPYGMWILVALVVLGSIGGVSILGTILTPVISWMVNLLLGLLGIS